ncbi:MAG TPA: polysaccharide deacetylase [Gallionella sp.]
MTDMLDVFFTVDVEVWCNGWKNLDASFDAAFRRYIYGPTAQGDYGLPFKLQMLADHGLQGVWFVEPLFALRFGTNFLAEIVGMIRQHGQEVQLHMHPEWLDEIHPALISGVEGKRRLMAEFSVAAQTTLIGKGIELLTQAGAERINAFRAGNYGFNLDTLRALAANGILFDSSYNAAGGGMESGLNPGSVLTEPMIFEGVHEYPVTVFQDGTSNLRPTQLTACSWREMEGLLWQALETGRRSFVIVSHNFELLDSSKILPSKIVIDRYERLCRFLSEHRDCFNVRGFNGLTPKVPITRQPPLHSSILKTGERMLQQLCSRF